MTNRSTKLYRKMPGVLFLTSLMVLFLAACGAGGNPPLASSLPAGQVNTQSETVGQPYPAQAIPQDNAPTVDAATLATRQASLEKSGKSEPTLPTGNVPESGSPPYPSGIDLLPEGGATSYPMETSQSEVGIAYPANPADSNLQLTPPTLSPDEIATRQAALNQSGKSAPTLPSGSNNKPGGNTRCLGSLGALLIALISMVFITKRKHY